MNIKFLTQLAHQLRVGKSPSCRCAVYQIPQLSTLLACFLTFAHLFLAAMAIAARAAADKTRFFKPTTATAPEATRVGA